MKGEMNELVRQLMENVARKSQGDADLAAKIAPKLGRKYANLAGSIANWRNLHDRMPAEALLAACQVTGVSIDEALFGRSIQQEQEALRAEQAELRAELVRQTELLGELLQRTPPAASR